MLPIGFWIPRACIVAIDAYRPTAFLDYGLPLGCGEFNGELQHADFEAFSRWHITPHFLGARCPLVWSWLLTLKNFVLALLAHACDVEFFARKIIAEMLRPAYWSVAPWNLAFVDSFRFPL